jgi:hypothetical protein
MNRCSKCRKKIGLAMAVAFKCTLCSVTSCSSECHSSHSSKCASEAIETAKQDHANKLLRNATHETKLEKI